ncbi:hypothetical protein OG474_09620 [Kribbella sp. NBC_01505]|uniref:P22 phage major capsid protein family protein n=1 Tax=Kribbella sp. NBC_01505 TaxID=2903580 RepID=UPI003870B6E6
MANTLYTAPDVVALANALASKDLVLAQTINRDYEANYGGGKGTSVNVRVPAVLKARTRDLTESGVTGQNSAFVVDTVTETTFTVSLDENPYSVVALNDRERTFELEDFGRQVLAPQIDALVDWVESKVAAEMTALAETATIAAGGAYDPLDPTKTFTAIRKLLRDNGLPTTGLMAACGTKVYKNLVDAKVFSDLGTQATNPSTGARPVAGFETFETNRLAEDDIVFYHKAAFTLAVRAPQAPNGAPFSASVSSNGFAMLHIQDYDSQIGSDRSLLSTFIGTQYIPARKVDRSGATAVIATVPSAYRINTTTVAA